MSSPDNSFSRRLYGRSTKLVLDKLHWLRGQRIWPNGRRYLWTDAFGVVLLVSLYHALQKEKYLSEAEWLVSEVERVLGRPRGIRIGEAPDRDGQYFHYLGMWLFALDHLGWVKPPIGRKPWNWSDRFIPALWCQVWGFIGKCRKI